jgi:heptosyltransferase-3
VRILIYRLGSLGDTVVALPCFRLIRSQNPDAEIVVLTNVPVSGKAAAIEAVLDSTGLVDRYIPYPLGLRDPKQLAALWREILAEKFDRVISLAAPRGFLSSVRDYLFFRACGITSITGIPWHRRDLEPAKVGGAVVEHESTRLLRRIGWTAPVAADGRDLALTPAEHTLAERLLDDADVAFPFIAASIGTKSSLNDWGEDNWRALLTELSRDFPRHGLVLIGSGEEKARSESLLEAWTGPRGNLCGAAGPRVTAAILARARLFLGHDSGPMHLAAATGIPVVAIFSARNPPGQWFPGGSGHGILYPYPFYDPARREDAAHQRAATQSITVWEVRREAHLHLPTPAAASLHRA